MSVLFIVLPLAILIAGAFVAAFAWAARTGQFDDLDTPAMRVASEDDITAPVKKVE
jgi:cbb3-type cytochrome oxidase maturation protein